MQGQQQSAGPLSHNVELADGWLRYASECRGLKEPGAERCLHSSSVVPSVPVLLLTVCGGLLLLRIRRADAERRIARAVLDNFLGNRRRRLLALVDAAARG